LQGLSEGNARRLGEVRATLEAQLAQLQLTNSAKLDEMRKTVDEKLQTTLETRLGESFKQVAERLEQVHKGLGRDAVAGAGRGRPAARADQRQDARHVRRGAAGGAAGAGADDRAVRQAGRDQAAQQPAGRTSPIRFPGRSADGTPVWLPIDAKFPRDDYERLLDAHDRADAAARTAPAARWK
jgi:DNA recombination protein RmuC